jgi:hypothetical protein
LTPGTRVGPYEVVATLGSGGMAEVYRARDSRLQREVALKVVGDALAGDTGFLARLEQEARLAGSLNHPNIVAVHDIGSHDGAPYIVSELLQGETLRDRMRRGAVPLSSALDWAVQIAQGLAAAHEHGIVHRDLKPENVFLTRSGHVKLLDFGIAKAAAPVASSHGLLEPTLTPGGAATRTGGVLGTPGYMSPEQVRGEPLDGRSDIFGLGCILYELLSGRRAFKGGSVVESGHAILHDDPAPLPDGVPAPVAQVVRRCLQKESEQRFQSARDVGFALDAVRGTSGALPLVAGGAVRLGRRRFAAVGLATLGVLAAAVAGFIAGRRAAPPVPSVEQITFRLGSVSAARFNPEGRVVFSAAWDGQPLELYARAPKSIDAQPLGLRDAALLAVSPSGELAVSLRRNERRGTLALVPAAGGSPREVAEDIFFADYSPTGELAVVRLVNSKLQVEWPLGTPIFETAGSILNLRVAPRGDWVAFMHIPVDKNSKEVLVVNSKGEIRTLYSSKSTGVGGLAWAPSGKEVWFNKSNAIWAASLSGDSRFVFQGVGEIFLHDISREGSVLVDARDSRGGIVFLAPDGQQERELSWVDGTYLRGLSDNGLQILVGVWLSRTSTRLSFIRPTDGSPPLKLGSGWPQGLSPDSRWVLLSPEDQKGMLSIVPVGAGTPRAVPLSGLYAGTARWLKDGKRIAFVGRRAESKEWRLYTITLAGGPPSPISTAAVAIDSFEVSGDDGFIAAKDADEVLTIYSVESGKPLPLPELGRGTTPIRWAQDGTLWVTRSSEVPGRVFRYDLGSRKILEERTLSPHENVGMTDLGRVCLSGDGRSVAFGYTRVLGNLFLLEGLAPTGK